MIRQRPIDTAQPIIELPAHITRIELAHTHHVAIYRDSEHAGLQSFAPKIRVKIFGTHESMHHQHLRTQP